MIPLPLVHYPCLVWARAGMRRSTARVRVAQLEETVQIIKAMWTQEKATFQGAHYLVLDAACEPRPDPLPPTLIGAFKPKMLRLMAKYADEWNVSSTTL